MTAGHGANIGNGFTKYVVVDDSNIEHTVIFPSMIGRASRSVAGSIVKLHAVDGSGAQWWTGEDALFASSAITMLSQQRLTDPTFIPALVRGALQRFAQQVPPLNGAMSGFCVTGLPATWAQDPDKARALGQRLRDAHNGYSGIRAIPEPLGIIYAMLLDSAGEIIGEPALQTGQIAIVDLGQLTADVAVVRRLVPLPPSLQTYQLGAAEPLGQIRALLSAKFDRDFSLFETDQIVRAGSLTVSGQAHALPQGWDRPLIDNGLAIAARLGEAWKSGSHLDAILIGGGGAEIEPIVDAILKRFPHAEVVDEPQLAIAQGYARLARRLARTV